MKKDDVFTASGLMGPSLAAAGNPDTIDGVASSILPNGNFELRFEDEGMLSYVEVGRDDFPEGEFERLRLGSHVEMTFKFPDMSFRMKPMPKWTVEDIEGAKREAAERSNKIQWE